MNGTPEAQMSEDAQNVNRIIGTEKDRKITKEQIMNRLHYNPENGIFTWINPHKYHSEKINTTAGSISISHCGKKYLHIGLDGERYSASRLAFVYVTGINPKIIDHKNGNSLDNRFCNLNNVDESENTQNHNRKMNKSGLPVGVRKSMSGKYVARIAVNKIKITIGTSYPYVLIRW